MDDPRPMIIDPDDERDNPADRAGLHVVLTHLDTAFVVFDEYAGRELIDVGHRSTDQLLNYVATELFARGDARSGRYRVDLPNDARNWPMLDDVIVTDEPMGESGVYIAWAAFARRMGYGMPTSGLPGSGAGAVDRDEARRRLAARHAAETRALAARARAERQALADEVGDDELCPPEWIETGSDPDEDFRGPDDPHTAARVLTSLARACELPDDEAHRPLALISTAASRLAAADSSARDRARFWPQMRGLLGGIPQRQVREEVGRIVREYVGRTDDEVGSMFAASSFGSLESVDDAQVGAAARARREARENTNAIVAALGAVVDAVNASRDEAREQHEGLTTGLRGVDEAVCTLGDQLHTQHRELIDELPDSNDVVVDALGTRLENALDGVSADIVDAVGITAPAHRRRRLRAFQAATTAALQAAREQRERDTQGGADEPTQP